MTDHTHVDGISGHARKSFSLGLIAILNLLLGAGEIAGGIVGSSMALISDGVHNLADSVSVILSYFSNRMLVVRPSGMKSFGYLRAEVLVAFINAAILIAVSIFIAYESILRFLHPRPVTSSLMLIVGGIAFVFNTISALILRHHTERDLNVRSAYLHMFADALLSLGVVAAALAIRATGDVWFDPLISLAATVYIAKESFEIILDAANILMENVPDDIDADRVRETIAAVEGVLGVHDLHIWSVNSTSRALSAHIVASERTLGDQTLILSKISGLLRERFSIDHPTIQIEPTECERCSIHDYIDRLRSGG